MAQKHYQTVDHYQRQPQVGRGLFDFHLLILHFKFQFSKSIKPSTFHIFLNLTYPLRKNISFPKCPKLTQKFTQNRKTLVNVLSGEIQRCLKRDLDIGRKAMLSDVKSAFKCILYSRLKQTRTTATTATRTSPRSPSTRIRIFLNLQLFLSRFKNFPVHTQRIQIAFTSPRASDGFRILSRVDCSQSPIFP